MNTEVVTTIDLWPASASTLRTLEGKGLVELRPSGLGTGLEACLTDIGREYGRSLAESVA